VQRIIDALPMDYMHYGYLYGDQNDSGCGTWGDAGNPDDPAVYSSYEQSSLLGGAQEIGHNLGMAHEHTMDCGGETMPDNTSSCSNVEYGSRLSFMGMGRGHPSAYHKVHMGWLSGCNVVTAGGEGTFTLHPLETPCNSTQVIQVAAPKSRMPPSGTNTNLTHYYLELRVPIGYDSNAVTSPQVMIYIAGQFSTTRQYARHTFLLDLTPSTSQLSDAGLATVGQSFADPGGGLTFTLDAISMTSASVRITGNGTGMHTCQGGTAFTAPGPADCGMGPGGGGGMGGAGPTGGTGGAPSGGTAGLGGSAGSGVSGSAGSGVVGGSGPTGGSAGSIVMGGTAGTPAGGTATGGSAGAPTAGSGTTIPAESELDSGCGCRTTGKRPTGTLLTGLVLFAFLRRRRARA
jgi:MYXO-CTERM domain-containing protein